MQARGIKNIVYELGADICGIAPVDRFENAPDGFHPADIYSDCKSVVVFAKKLPSGSLKASSCVPYTHVNNVLTREVDKLGIKISIKLEENNINAVSLPSDDPYEYWEPENKYGRAILSMRHAAYLAGLGKMGKNTLLINDKYGNMIQIGAVLADIDLQGDDLADYTVCPEGCSVCIDSCPVEALNGRSVNQKKCRPLSNYETEKGYILKKCNICRNMCPNKLGIY
ncbi:MAG: epoxyqueuosine reductase [Candidatus Mcinerneyibacterium aminivorans]|uniref:Epoxyqueuosine reductase n=1 Tax=Candidatus Mcinerneyibacterium aminivorans TaxID=2703815 RepID=A0A5D0MHP7_9BACT|nr:MAG: epoxyqueuosine reductase [Candidatus Mcinerneyibacterium aminivorans]